MNCVKMKDASTFAYHVRIQLITKKCVIKLYNLLYNADTLPASSLHLKFRAFRLAADDFTSFMFLLSFIHHADDILFS